MTMKRLCTLQLTLDEWRGEIRYKPRIFSGKDPEGEAYFPQPWKTLKYLLERWGVAKANMDALRTKADKNEQAILEVEIEETYLNSFSFIFKPDDIV